MKAKKILAVFLTLPFIVNGCGQKSNDMPVVSVAQIVSHRSLNTIRDSFKAELKTLGYRDGQNISLTFKDAGGQQNQLDSILSTFEGNQSDVIVTIATATTLAAAKYANRIPVVFSAVSDPIGSKLLNDLQKPNKNITGTSDEVQVDQILDLAKKVQPSLKKLGFLYNSSEANSIANLKKAKAYCKENNLELIEGSGANISELQSALEVLMGTCDGIFTPNDNTVASSMSAIVASSLKHKIPIYTGADSMVADGGFASVGIDYQELGKETAKMVDQLLKGKKVKDIPVKVFKDDLNIYINRKTMEALHIDLPSEVVNDSALKFL